MEILLVATYDLGHQPFGLASPARWLRDTGHRVSCADLSVDPFPAEACRRADLIAFYVPMHTATRLAAAALAKCRGINPGAAYCFYGLYAPLNASYLRDLGAHAILGGEFEPGLVALADRLQAPGPSADGFPAAPPMVSLERLAFRVPDRRGLAPLDRYPRLRTPGGLEQAGYTEASRGCKHHCRHCPVVPVYQGRFRVVQPEVVLADIRQQVEAGARHITFGDPDFWNGPGHADRLVKALAAEFPDLTYDVTIKIEHLLARRDRLALLRETGCLFVTSAVESVEDAVLERLAKGHTRGDFLAVAAAFRAAGLALAPTFVPFTPWSTWQGYGELLRLIDALGLVEQVAPIQLTLRLLVPRGSHILDLPDFERYLAGYDEAALIYRWRHPDARLDRLGRELMALVSRETRAGASRAQIFGRIWERVFEQPYVENPDRPARASVPYLEEPWYC